MGLSIISATIDHELALRHKYDLDRIETEVHAKTKSARENRDVNLEMMRASEEEHRKTMIEKIQFVLSMYELPQSIRLS